MQQYWIRWENWMTQHAPRLLNLLRSGASFESVESLEKLIGTALPPAFKTFYAIHDGQQKARAGLIDADQLLSMEDITAQWYHWKDQLDAGTFTWRDEPIQSTPDTGIKNDWWNPLWIPFTSDGFGNHLCIDLDPAPGGKHGQIITLWHDDSHRAILAPSFEAWLEDYLTALEKGEYIFVKKWGIVHKDTFLNYND
ncbi:SMI1/KNR4 family protein [Chitinophaga eiseniae]|uniref:Molybdenum cofactor biosynthesis protein MoeA n=1 Tax=Chitinophaga eiseniae TaxID=634771 RepID=A0A847SLR5_9BACT|nr:SMI1/KNR4 family protein [Chitinophaga eiseniae]NLR78558.1 molybdenum cofactor biosynthesis protein MoeA [Chitinophaga eiseniae]